MSLLSVAAAHLRDARIAPSDNYGRVAEKIERFIAEVASETISDRCGN